MRKLCAGLLLAALTGCAQYTLVEPERVVLNEVISVEPRTAWNRVSNIATQGPVVVWTADGPSLDRLMFFTGIADGEPLLKPVATPSSGAPNSEPPAFRSDMSPTEIAELFEATISRTMRSPLTSARNLRPVEFSGIPGFRFDFTYVGRDEVEHDGVVIGAVRDDELYLIVYEGTRLYYYDKHLQEVEQIAASARLL